MILGRSSPKSLILRCRPDEVGAASKDGGTLWGSCFEAPLRGAPQHEGEAGGRCSGLLSGGAGVIRLALLALLLSLTPALAVQPDEQLSDPALEARAREISEGLRCMVCQNQSIDDSNAPLARDLRLLVRERLTEGDTNQQVRDYLVARYGDFILLKPRFVSYTLLLWLTPVAVLLVGAVVAFARFRRPIAAFGGAFAGGRGGAFADCAGAGIGGETPPPYRKLMPWTLPCKAGIPTSDGARNVAMPPERRQSRRPPVRPGRPGADTPTRREFLRI